MSLPGSYFDRLYEQSSDPWSFRSRSYEQRKRTLTLASLQAEHYATAFEPGCSIGVLTAALAERCDRLTAMDVSAAALEEARRVVPGNVSLIQGGVPQDWPEGRFDLVVLSEVAYYLDLESCRLLGRRAVGGAEELVAVHWRHPVDDYPLSGDEVHDELEVTALGAGMSEMVNHVEEDFRLQIWSRDPRSVARRTGVPGS